MGTIRWDGNGGEQDSSGITDDPSGLFQGYSRESPPLSNGLVGWWPLHDETGQDISGNGNHGTPNGGVTTGVAGKGGLRAMSFDGSDDYINYGDVSAVENQTELTISAWVKIPSTTADHHRILSKEYVIYVGRSGGNFSFYVGDGTGWLDSNKTFGDMSDTDTWIFVTYVMSGSDISVYKNAVLEATATFSITSTGSNNTGMVSGIIEPGNLSQQWEGEIANLRVYNRALPESEIQTLYEWGATDVAKPPTDGVAYYPLDGDATDEWGSNDGTAYGGLVYSSDSIRGQSGSHDGSDDYIEVPDSTDLQLTGNFTISFWEKLTANTNDWQSVIDKRTPNTWEGYCLQHDHNSNNKLRIHSNVGDFYVSRSPELNNWYHYLLSFDGSTYKWYINGEFDSEKDMPSLEVGVEPLKIGASNYQPEYFNGNIDDVRIYDYALTPSEVHDLYQWGTRGRDMRKFTVNQ